jgi:hypothetical protein
VSNITPSMAAQAAETAHNEVTRLTLKIQQLQDAVRGGQVANEHDLHVLLVDCRVLGVAVAQTFHALAHVPRERRDVGRIDAMLRVEASHA